MNKINEIDVSYLYQLSSIHLIHLVWMDFIQMQEFINKKAKTMTIENDEIVFK